MDDESLEVHVLKLLKAFFRIESSATRQIIVALTESAASGTSLKAEFIARQSSGGIKPN